MKFIQVTLIAALFGFCVGALMGLSVRHPVHATTIAKFDTACSGAKPDVYQTSLSGDIYAVRCSNGILIKTDH